MYTAKQLLYWVNVILCSALTEENYYYNYYIRDRFYTPMDVDKIMERYQKFSQEEYSLAYLPYHPVICSPQALSF